jgi:uncharacterized repeat protein (TIGR04076 family)
MWRIFVMKLVKITVLKCAWNGELAEKYAKPGLGPCDFQKPGQVFYTNGWQKPEGMCDNAWKSMMEYAMTLAQGGGNFYNGELKDPHAFIASCNDGFRPVSFLLEATEQDASVFM